MLIRILNSSRYQKKPLELRTIEDQLSKYQLSVFHLKIRSIPANLTQFRAHLDTLSMNFKIIALSETAINSHHPYYNIPGYSIEQNFRPKRKGGGVALYIDSNLQYKVRNYLNFGDNTNSIFVEIDRNQLKSKYNTVHIQTTLIFIKVI